MKKLLITTMLVSALAAGPVLAQTADPATTAPAATSDPALMPEMTVPEGFMRQDVVLTAADLIGATIYDSSGESIGEVHDLVLDIAANTSEGSQAAGQSGDSMTGTGMTPEGTASTSPEGSAATGVTPDPSTSDQAGNGSSGEDAPDTSVTPGTSSAGLGTDEAHSIEGASGTTSGGEAATEGSSNAADNAEAGTTIETEADIAGAATTDGDTSAADTTSGSVSTLPEGTATDDTSTSGTAASSGDTGGSTQGQATHVIMDIGGFLGIGQHRVALPISDLALYRSDNDTRVYLPWSREQIEALPAYDENDPATLGRSGLNGAP